MSINEIPPSILDVRQCLICRQWTTAPGDHRVQVDICSHDIVLAPTNQHAAPCVSHGVVVVCDRDFGDEAIDR